jgi:hypothetical protein
LYSQGMKQELVQCEPIESIRGLQITGWTGYSSGEGREPTPQAQYLQGMSCTST